MAITADVSGRLPKVAQPPVAEIITIKDDMELQSGPSDSGQARLEQMGYKQELDRKFDMFSSFSASFTMMSFMLGVTGSLSIGYNYGGPVAAVWGFVIVSAGNLVVGLAMAEIASAYPISGGPYCWTLELAGTTPLYTLIAWMTGWVNVLGQFAATTAAGFLTAKHIAVMFDQANGHNFSPFEFFLAYAICLLVSGLISSMHTNVIRIFSVLSAVFMVAGGAFIVAVLPLVAPKLQPPSYVFTFFDSSTMHSLNLPNNAYIFLSGMMMAQYSFVGYEASAQLAEETKRADKITPWAIVWSIITTSFCGFVFLVILLFCVQDKEMLFNGTANGYVVLQIFCDVFQGRFGSPAGGIALSAIPLIAMFNATVISMTTNARMLYSLSRDKGVPLHQVWAAVNRRTRTPVNSTWAMTTLAFLLGLPILFSTTAFLAAASICFIGLYTSYAVPILLRIIFHRNFEAGPFKLQHLQPYLNILALLFIAFSVVCFCLPTEFPVNIQNLNWTPVSAGIVIAGVLIAWYFPMCGARHWYRGKSHTLQQPTSSYATGLPRRSRY